jgi:hypothetical protein
VALGLGLTTTGYLLFVPSRDDKSLAAEIGLFLLFGAGPVCCLNGLLLYALRAPTERELSPRIDDYSTRHFRPLGLVAFLVWAGVVLGLKSWAETYRPPRGDVGSGLLLYAFGVLVVMPLCFRRVRDLFFYPMPPAKQ